MEAKHTPTPGPWQCYADLPSTEPNWHIITNASRMRVIANVHIEPGNAMDEANARLLAAAPELLEALMSLLEHPACQASYSKDREMARRVDRAVTAILKAGVKLPDEWPPAKATGSGT